MTTRPSKSPMFYVYWIWAVIVIAIGLATIGNCASDAQMIGIDAGTATFLVGIVSTANGAARVIMGTIYDKTNVKVTMLIDAIVAIAATVFVLGSFATGIAPLYVVGAICCGFCYGSVPVVAAAMARQRFGSKNYPLNLSLANFAIVFGSLLNIAVQAAVGSSTERMAVFAVMAVLAVIATIDVLPFSKMWNRDMGDLAKRRAEAGKATRSSLASTRQTRARLGNCGKPRASGNPFGCAGLFSFTAIPPKLPARGRRSEPPPALGGDPAEADSARRRQDAAAYRPRRRGNSTQALMNARTPVSADTTKRASNPSRSYTAPHATAARPTPAS